ncbi:putative Transposase, MuDR, plant [Cocos nucifera]|uniref:Putative Transposase, MuDR, plant n=1 Tax=Cocos nucifera TaxID=13894 RepID=A0A8K0I2E1_COCNU|nr:putative Transposase, MuDR, plant [Cocos nucifera]
MCKEFNSILVDPRGRPIITMLEAIRNYVMVRMHHKRDEGLKWSHNYTPRVLKKLEQIKQRCTA